MSPSSTMAAPLHERLPRRQGASGARTCYAAAMAEGDRARWDARWHERRVDDGAAPSSFLVALEDVLPRGDAVPAPRALDVAGGAGRNAIWLARRGLAVTLVDVSPVALERARAAAARAGVSLDLVAADLEREALPPGPFDVVVSVDFLWRPLFAALPAVLTPGGILVVVHPTRRNLERHAHPTARFLLAEGELRTLVARDFVLLRYDEDWFDDRHEARLAARRR